jgi:hypothetical protein
VYALKNRISTTATAVRSLAKDPVAGHDILNSHDAVNQPLQVVNVPHHYAEAQISVSAMRLACSALLCSKMVMVHMASAVSYKVHLYAQHHLDEGLQ